MRIASKSWIAAVLSFAITQSVHAAPVTVDSTGILAPNPNNLTITEVGNTSLATARALIAAAHTAGNGGTIDFQQKFQGGTFPNAPLSNNGVDVATDPANPLQVTASSSGGVATGSVIFSFYRSDVVAGDGSDPAAVTNIDSNTNQGSSIISGGYKSRYPGAVSATNPLGDGLAITGPVDFTTTPPTVDSVAGTATTGVGGGYMGITNTGSPATLVFNNGLSFFGITALPRGATRDTLLTLTETPLAGGSPISVVVSGVAQIVGANAVFFGQAADAGYAITGAVFTNPNGQGVNRYDDLAFVVAVPEPGSLALIGLGGLGILVVARRRLAILVS